jgi:hypothetical protein
MTVHRQTLQRLAGTLVFSALLSACGGGADGGTTEPPQRPPVSQPPIVEAPDSRRLDLVMQIKPGFDIAPLAASFGLTVIDQFGQRPIYRVRGAAGSDAAALLLALQGDTRVRFAEVDVENSAPEARRFSVWAIGGDAGVFATQWAPASLRLARAHTVSQGDGVRVAVLDSGAELNHPLLAPRLARRADGQLLGRDFVDDDNDPSEEGAPGQVGYGHGTHVAGLVALAAPAAKLMPVRVLDRNGRGNGWVLAEALGWAIDPDGDPKTDDGAHVINLSLGSTQPTQLLKLVTGLASCDFDDDSEVENDPRFAADVARCAAGFQTVVMAAAGNAGSADERIYPAAEQAKGTLAITASNVARRLSDFANTGSWVSLAAPGELITSSVPGGAYGVWSGTSMASPLAAGTAALVLASWPAGADRLRSPVRQWTAEAVTKRLTDRAGKLCATSMLQLDAAGAVLDEPVADPSCP